MSEIFIYALVNPNNQNDVRYVGKSSHLKKRLNDHRNRTFKDKTKNGKWIYELRESGLFPEMIILDCVPTEEGYFWEQYYIDLLKSWGFNLNNHTISMPSKLYGHSKESIELMRDIKLIAMGVNKEEWVNNNKQRKERTINRKMRLAEERSNKPSIFVTRKDSGEYVGEFKTSWEIGKVLGLNYKKIDRVLSNDEKYKRFKSYKGFVFSKN